jgi:glycosyltransferase involved in cell wall biosynthesis
VNDPTTPTVSVLVPTHNRGDRLAELLDALETEPADEIIVVVNGKRDSSLEILEARAKADPRIKSFWVEEPSQLRSLQVAAGHATSDVLLMLDDDVIPEPGLVKGHARHHATGSDLIVVGYMPTVKPTRRRPGEFPLYLYDRAYENTCDEYERDPRAILTGYWAGDVSVQRGNALRVGFDPSADLPSPYFNHRDRDFGLRCREAGLRGVFDRSLRARHKHKLSAAGFVRSARGSGYNQWVIHQVHADVIGPLPEDFYERGAGWPGKLLVRWARYPHADAVIPFFLRQLTKAAGLLHLFRLESHAGFLLGMIERQRGALEAAATVGPMMERDVTPNSTSRAG